MCVFQHVDLALYVSFSNIQNTWIGASTLHFLYPGVQSAGCKDMHLVAIERVALTGATCLKETLPSDGESIQPDPQKKNPYSWTKKVQVVPELVFL